MIHAGYDPYATYAGRLIESTQDTPGIHGPAIRDVHAMIAGQVDPHDPEIGAQIIVNPREFGITGWGDLNSQQFQSGHTNAMPQNDAAEQGFGVGPERKWGHYPTADNPNPFRNRNALQRSGGDTYSGLVYRPVVAAYWAQAIGHELSQVPVKQRASGYGTVEVAPSVPFVTTVAPITPGGY